MLIHTYILWQNGEKGNHVHFTFRQFAVALPVSKFQHHLGQFLWGVQRFYALGIPDLQDGGILAQHQNAGSAWNVIRLVPPCSFQCLGTLTGKEQMGTRGADSSVSQIPAKSPGKPDKPGFVIGDFHREAQIAGILQSDPTVLVTIQVYGGNPVAPGCDGIRNQLR